MAHGCTEPWPNQQSLKMRLMLRRCHGRRRERRTWKSQWLPTHQNRLVTAAFHTFTRVESSVLCRVLRSCMRMVLWTFDLLPNPHTKPLCMLQVRCCTPRLWRKPAASFDSSSSPAAIKAGAHCNLRFKQKVSKTSESSLWDVSQEPRPWSPPPSLVLI